MKNIITLFCLTFIAQIGLSQPPNYDDLKILYADADYEKLAKVASKYVESDKTKKDVIPYMWLSRGLYKIHLSGTAEGDFKNAFKDAISYLGKGMKLDYKNNSGSTVSEFDEFVDEFQKGLFEVIDNDISAGAWQKAYGWAIRYQKVTQNQAGIKYVMGVCKFEAQDKTTARSLWQEADILIKETESIESWTKADKDMLKIGVLYSAAALNKSRQGDKARDLLNKVAHWFENDDDWKERYDLIIN